MASSAQSGRPGHERNGLVDLEIPTPNDAANRRTWPVCDHNPRSFAEIPNEAATLFTLA
jgi:hypothetical protein